MCLCIMIHIYDMAATNTLCHNTLVCFSVITEIKTAMTKTIQFCPCQALLSSKFLNFRVFGKEILDRGGRRKEDLVKDWPETGGEHF